MADDTPPPVQAPDPNPYANPKNPNNLIERVQAILLKPTPTWDVIETETPTVQQLYTSYIIPLAAIGPVASAIGGVVFGVGAFGVSYHTPLVLAIITAAVSYVLSLVMIYVVALVIDGLAPSFNGQKNFIQALKLAAYSSTAAWVAGILGIIPTLGALVFLAMLYGIYLFYLGLPKLMKNPADKTIVYMIVTAVVQIVLSMVVGAVVGSISTIAVMGAGGNPFASNSHVSGTVSVNGNSVDLQKAATQMEATANQMAAQASAAQTGQTVVKLADASALLGLIPASYMGAARTNDSTSSGGAGGVSLSSAESTYNINGGTVRVKVTDLGTIAGFGAVATAFNVNASSSSATGYEKTVSQNGNLVTEEWDSASKHGSYTTVTGGGRVSVEVEGDNVDMSTIKSVANAIDVNRAVALTK